MSQVGTVIMVFTFFVMSLISTYTSARGLEKKITDQQNKIDTLTRELEEVKRKLEK